MHSFDLIDYYCYYYLNISIELAILGMQYYSKENFSKYKRIFLLSISYKIINQAFKTSQENNPNIFKTLLEV